MDIFYPLQLISDWVTFALLNLEIESHLGGAVNFFVYDSLKILGLLIVINYFMAIIRYYVPTEKIRDFLTKRNWYGLDYFLASAFGVITPFCSCSSIPLFIGFLSAGIPLGVTLSFLITSPLVNEASIAIFLVLFGVRTTLLYVLAGIGVGMVGGAILGRMKLDNYIDDKLQTVIKASKQNTPLETHAVHKPFGRLAYQFWLEGWDLTKKIFMYVLIGVGLGAIIHGYVPSDFFERYLTNSSWWSVPVATILAVPLYSNAVGVIPIMQALVAKGVPFGTALAFMMATVGLSLPEALILKRAMKKELLISFFTVVTLGIIIIGYLFNFYSPTI